MKLSGKTALITGGAKRIGKAIALALASNGANIVIHYRSSKKEAEDTAREIERLGVNVWIIQSDLSVSSESENLIRSIRKKNRYILFIINNDFCI